MAVRLSSGSRRGRPRAELRPTASRTLQAVFNMLRGEVEGKNILDLYAGVGSYGVMALRQGADSAVFVDNTRASEKRISQALAKYHLEDRALYFHEDVEHFLHASDRWESGFDIVFADPPYSQVPPGALVEALCASGLVGEEGILVIEHSSRTAPPEHSTLRLRKSRVFGDTTVSIYQHRSGGNPL